MRPLDLPCSEQGKLPTAKAFKLAERDNTYVRTRNNRASCRSSTGGLKSTIIGPLFASETDEEDWEPAIERVKKAIRQKVLESYRNGQAAGPRQPVPERRKAFQR